MDDGRRVTFLIASALLVTCASFPRLDRPPLAPPDDAHWLDGGSGLRLYSAIDRPPGATATVWFVLGPEIRSSPLYPRLTEALHRAGFATAVVHPRGAGYSDGPRGDAEDFEAVLADHARFFAELERLSPGPVFLFGHSAGAAFALDVLTRSPRPIAGLVLVNPAYRFKQTEGMTPTAGQVVQFAVNLVFRPAAITVDMNSNPDVVAFGPDREEGLAMQHDPLVVRYFSMRFMTAEQRVLQASKQAIASVDAPLLIVEGAHDALIDPAGTDELFALARSPDKRRLSAPDGGHGPSAVETMTDPLVDWLLAHADAGR